MSDEPTASGGGDPGQVTRIAEEFIRLHEAGQVTDLDEYCARYPEDQRAGVRNECEQLLRIHGVIKQPDRLSAGQTLGSYKIIESIGKGGMGEVYRARDSELERDIAIKVLPPELACQPERVKRFKREAKAIAALDHPNIVTIHSVEESGGLHFITMQLVQGKTLSGLIPKKGMALGDYFDLAIPLADAISTAHESGITHRDLKPANIMVTPEGRVEILDFGLAKLTEQTSPEQTTKLRLSSLTDEGQIVGTVAYMSPEQAEGRDVDHRTDIFSLGIILYEMITGERPFKGESRVALMSSIMKDTPSAVTELKATLPRHLGRIVKRCLAKDVRQRYQTATDVCNELEELKKEIDSGVSVAPLQQVGGRSWLWPVVSAVLLVGLVVALVVPRSAPSGPDTGGRDRGPLVLAAEQLTDLSGHQVWPSISPDGESYVYTDANDGDIYWQPIGAAWNPRLLTEENSDTDNIQAAYHPKENKIAFRRDDSGIRVMETAGAQSRGIGDPSEVDSQGRANGGFHPAWSPNGTELVYVTWNDTNAYLSSSGDLKIVDVASGESRFLTDARYGFAPSWSPHDNWIAFTASGGGEPWKTGQRDIWIIRTWGGEPRMVTNDLATDSYPFWSPDGRFLFFISDRNERPSLWAVRIDEDSGEVGEPLEVWAPTTGRILSASISADGLRIVCSVMTEEYRIRSFEFDRASGQLAGGVTELYSTNQRHVQGLTLSPDNAWLAFATTSGQEDVLVLRADDGSREPINVTHDAHKARVPEWYPETSDGYWLTFVSDRDGRNYQIYAAQPDRVADPRLLTDTTRHHRVNVWTPDARFLGSDRDVGVYEFPDGFPGEASEPYEYTDSSQGFAAPPNNRWSWSPNGELIASVANRDRSYITVRSADDGEMLHEVRDPKGNLYAVRGRQGYQYGNRWLDDKHFIFWELDLEKAFLWDTDTETATVIDGLDGPGEFVFSEKGETLFALQREYSTTDIWLLELDAESLGGEIGPTQVFPEIPWRGLPVFLGAKVKRLQGFGERTATGMDADRGVLVVEVPEDSIAYAEGLRDNDVILSVGGEETNDPSELQPAYLKTASSDKCEFIIFRDQLEETIEVDGVLAVRLTAKDANGSVYYDPSLGVRRSWIDDYGSLSWDLEVRGEVTFDVFAEISGHPDAAGATWSFNIDGQKRMGTTPNTGAWEEFTQIRLDPVTIEANGDVHAVLEPETMPGTRMMFFRAIELKRIE